MDPAPARPP
uniref:Uncharacterized protein n=1 Tax=Arundo donax TaxID=35708 RepID=A0A0A9BTT7_ARUDO